METISILFRVNAGNNNNVNSNKNNSKQLIQIYVHFAILV